MYAPSWWTPTTRATKYSPSESPRNQKCEHVEASAGSKATIQMKRHLDDHLSPHKLPKAICFKVLSFCFQKRAFLRPLHFHLCAKSPASIWNWRTLSLFQETCSEGFWSFESRWRARNTSQMQRNTVLSHTIPNVSRALRKLKAKSL